jgi:hypothetical protein
MKRLLSIFVGWLVLAGGQVALAAEIWLNGVSPFVHHKLWQDAGSDFFELFKPDAAWSKSAQHVKVFKTNGGAVMREPDGEVKAMFADLKRRHIPLAIEMGLLTGRSPDGKVQECGVGIEGFTSAGYAKLLANRIKMLGGELAFVAMDEPLWYGHHFKGKNGCQWPMERVAQNMMSEIADLRAQFPNVQIGDTEPVGTAQPPDWVEEIAQWTQVYQKVTGEKLSFFHADVVWNVPWQQQFSAIKNQMHRSGIKFGVIYDGGGTGKQESDVLWNQEAAERFRAVESNPSLVPDQVVFQSWVQWPHKMLPETQPGTMTNLVLQYVEGNNGKK